MPKQETKSLVLLQHHLKSLRLPTILRESEKVAQRCATENVDHLGFLLQLCELELIERERKAAERRLKSARFPNLKNARLVRLFGSALCQQTAGDLVDARGVHREAGKRPAGW